MRRSKIFGNKELELLESRLSGNKKDSTGLWARTGKPKLEEIYTKWFPLKRKLKRLLK